MEKPPEQEGEEGSAIPWAGAACTQHGSSCHPFLCPDVLSPSGCRTASSCVMATARWDTTTPGQHHSHHMLTSGRSPAPLLVTWSVHPTSSHPAAPLCQTSCSGALRQACDWLARPHAPPTTPSSTSGQEAPPTMSSWVLFMTS